LATKCSSDWCFGAVRRRGQRRHRFDALAFAGQQQPRAVIVQRYHAVGMADDTDQFVDVGFEFKRQALVSRRSMVPPSAARLSSLYETPLIRGKLDFATQ
jgi:hypothetical protein